MTQENNQTNSNLPVKINWRTRSYLIWTAVGTFFGVLSGYLYTRAAKEHADRHGGEPPKPGTLEMVGLIVAAMAMVRQITELGRPDEDKK